MVAIILVLTRCLYWILDYLLNFNCPAYASRGNVLHMPQDAGQHSAEVHG